MPTDPSNPFKLTFKAAVNWFRKRLAIPAKDWKAVQGEENAWAFAVAEVQSAEMLSDFKAALDRYIAEGSGFNQFSKDFREISERYGWQPKQGIAWRANIVASTNLRQAYAAGQYEQRQRPEVKVLRPGLRWVHRDSPIPRPHHLVMDGKVFDSDDPAIQGVNLPQGFGCRCRWQSVRKPKNGYFALSDRLPYSLPDGETINIPAIPVGGKLYPIAEKGFYRASGQSRLDERVAILRGMIERQPPEMRAKILATLPDELKEKLDFAETDFADRGYVRDSKGRFSKVAGSKHTKSKPSKPQDGESKDLIKAAALRIVKEDKESGKYKYFLLKNGKKYDQIVANEGVEAADKAHFEYAQKRAKRQIEETLTREKINSERELIEKSGTSQQKQEMEAFDRLHPEERHETTIEDWKAKNPEAAKTLLTRYDKEIELDKRFSLENIQKTGKTLTSSLAEDLTKMNNDPNESLVNELLRMDRFKREILDSGMNSEAAKKRVNLIEFDGTGSNKDAVEEFFKFTGVEIPSLKKVYEQEGRAFAVNESITINPSEKTTTVWHEMAHHIEFSNQRIKQAAGEWRDNKATGPKQKLSELTGDSRYEDNEEAVPDKYVSPYVGKVYTNKTTEVISTGMEAFDSSVNMLKLWYADRSHFEFIVGVLRA